MAGFIGLNSETANEKDDKDAKPGQNRQDLLNFRKLLAIICGCEECDLDFPLRGLPDNGGEWLDHFKKAETCADPTCKGEHLVTGWPVPDIDICLHKVTGKIDPRRSPQQNLFTALAMATLAMAQKDMRENGAFMEAKTAEEMIYLMIAAEYLGLRIKNPNPEILASLDKYKQQLKADDIWQNFVAVMREDAPAAAPQEAKADAADTAVPAEETQTAQTAEPATAAEKPVETPPPQAEKDAPAEPAQEETGGELTQIFNRKIAPEARLHLEAEKIDEELYKHISEAIIRDQDARGASVREKYKEKYNLTSVQLRGIFKAMDAEGITSVSPGKPRTLHYGPNGLPLEPAKPAIS